jgi:thiol-disulfide isomerase/thioredoxin
MKNFFTLLFFGILLALVSCKDGERAESAQVGSNKTVLNKQFTVNSSALQKDFTTWWNYTYYNVQLSQNFVGLDVDSMVIKKADFLSRLTTGKVVPFKLMIRNGVTYYKLYPLNEAVPAIKSTIQQKAITEIDHFKREGQPLPAYKFTDITGKTYTPASTKGKVVVLKFWFIGCVACVKEFPEVNQVVDRYKGRNDILFISLASDGKEELINFLKKNPLNYATVPHMKDFMQFQLDIGAYPTHILVDRAGNIVKVVNRIDELEPFIEKQAATTSL